MVLHPLLGMAVAAAEEIPPLAVVAVGLAAIAALLGPRALAALMAGLFRFVPVIGGWVADHLEENIVGGLDWAIGKLWGMVGGAVAFMWKPVAWLITLFGALGAGLGAAAGFGWRVVTQYIPEAENRAQAFASSVAADAEHYAQAAVQEAEDVLVAELRAVETGLEAVIAAEAAVVRAELGAVETFVGAEVTAAERFTQDAVGALGTAEAAALSALQAQAFARIDALGRALGADLDGLRDWVGGEVGALERSLDGLYQDALRKARDWAGAAEVAGVGAAAVVATDLETYLRECGRDLCSGLHGLSRVEQILGALFAGDVLLELIRELAHDREAVVRDLEEVGGALASDTARAFRALVGV